MPEHRSYFQFIIFGVMPVGIPDIFLKFLANASVRSIPVWFARQIQHHNIGVFIAQVTPFVTFLVIDLHVARAISLASSPTSSVRMAILVSSLK